MDVAFTDSSLDLRSAGPQLAAALPRLEEACGTRFARVDQVHGAEVLVADEPGPPPPEQAPQADALVTATRGLGLMVRAADCVPVLLADPGCGVIGAVHSGRQGTVLDVAGRAVRRMRDLGAEQVTAWLGPRVCGGCYEVPEEMREEVAGSVPQAWAETTWGTPALDLGAGVRAQLEDAGVHVTDAGGCTREETALHSHRRDGTAAGRMAAVVWTS